MREVLRMVNTPPSEQKEEKNRKKKRKDNKNKNKEVRKIKIKEWKVQELLDDEKKE
jgi:hypothetical protein